MNHRNDSGSPGSRRINAAQASSAIVPNTLWNVLGAGLPMLLAIITVPVLIHSIGTERFGVFTIAYVLLGYFGLFDLGLGRATIKFLAEAIEYGRVAEGRALFWTSLILNGALGFMGAALFTALTPLLVGEVLNIPSWLRSEALEAFYMVAWSVPLVTVLVALRGVLEAQHRFRLISTLQIPVSAFSQTAPLLVLPFSYDLRWLVGALVFSRLLGTVVFLVAAIRQLDSPFEGPFFLRKKLGGLFSYGGWLTVTNIIGPLMVYADRFLVGSLSSMTAVAYYTIPYDAITRLLVLPESLARTTFPIFSAEAELDRRTDVYLNAINYLTLTFAPVMATIIVFAPDLLRLWVGEAFAENSTAVLQILALGVFVNSLALIPYTLIQGMGRPDITAKFHLLELPFYLILLWYGVQYWGVAGAAVAWTVRVSADGLLLAFYVHLTSRLSCVSAKRVRTYRSLVLSVLVVLSSWLLYDLTNDSTIKLAIWGLLLGVISYGGWRRLLTTGERQTLAGFVKTVLVKARASVPAFWGGRSG